MRGVQALRRALEKASLGSRTSTQVEIATTPDVDTSWWATDFRRFCGLIDIVPKSGIRQKLVLNPIQEMYCEARTARDVVLKPRQIGFTTLEQARDVWTFLTKPGARVVVTCQSITDHLPLKQLSKNFRVMFESLTSQGIKLNFRSPSQTEWILEDRDASLRIVEAGASEAAAEKKGRAGTITRLHITETAFYEYAEQTLNALLECVPGPEFGTEIVSESTANGAGGVFYDQYFAAKEKRSGYAAHFYPWFMHPEYSLPLDGAELVAPQTERESVLVKNARISLEQLKWYQRKRAEKKSQELLDQEYPNDPETCFLVSGRSFFDLQTVDALVGKTRPPIQLLEKGNVQIFESPVAGVEYLVAADPAEGTGGDYSAALVYRRDTGAHVATIHGQIPPWEFGAMLARVGKMFCWALIGVERNNHGHAVLQALMRHAKYPTNRVFHDRDDKPGWLNTEVTRTSMLDAFDSAIRRNVWKTPDVRVLREMRVFVVNKNGKAEAQPGKNDDLIIAGGIGWNMLTTPGTNRAIPGHVIA